MACICLVLYNNLEGKNMEADTHPYGPGKAIFLVACFIKQLSLSQDQDQDR